ncbi:MAG: MltA domain-containing protein [Phycisphaerales bacterium]|jgi:membrane-bound lytic murein transglycosylase A|nr:MltA domain-containing protein [Phycisphaerales bacterium]
MNKLIIHISALLIGLPACTSKQTITKEQTDRPNYNQPLIPGSHALAAVDFDNWPDLGTAWDSRDLFLLDSIDNSILWYDAPSSKQWFPIEGVTHEQAKISAITLKSILENSNSKEEFIEEVNKRFNLYESVGCDGNGTVLFTGYYSPDFQASRTKTETFKSPLYKRPSDLVTDPNSGTPLGRKKLDGSIESWLPRKELETSGDLDGTELVWVKDDLDAYTIHVNGSARLRLNDGELMYIGYAGKTDHEYTGLGQSILDSGLLPVDNLSLRAIRRLYDRDPKTIKNLIDNNESYVFFKEYNGEKWPAGSLGVPVTPERSIATDKKIFPRGSVVLVDTTVRSLTGEKKRFTQFMTDQDTGGAIRAPGRADLFMGVGPTAGIKAGGQYAEGKLYYLFLKPESIAIVNE